MTATVERPATTPTAAADDPLRAGPVSGGTTPPPVVADEPRRIARSGVDDLASLVGSLGGALALTWLLYENVLLFSGILGFLMFWWLTFMVLYAAVSAIDNSGPVVRDRLVKALVHTGALVVAFALATAIVYTIWQGHRPLFHVNFYLHDMSGVQTSAPLDQGGIEHAIVGTAIQIGIATAISLPLGIGTAIYLSEVGDRLSVVVRTVVEAMTALPDILAGLFVYAIFVLILGWDKSGIAVALALSVTMVPVVARSAEVVLRVVPGGLREASLALGASRWKTVWSVVLPTARSGLATALILGIARVAGETAPLLIVSGTTTFFNKDPFHQSMTSLPLYTYSEIRAGAEGIARERAFGAASVLLIFVLLLFVTARLVARNKVGNR